MFKVLLSLFVLTSSLYSANQSRLQNVPQRKALEFSPKQQEQQLAIQQQYSCFLRQLCHQLASASAPTLSRQTHVSSQDTTTPQLVVSAPASKQSTTPRRTSSTNSVNVLLEAANIETSNVLLEAANVFLEAAKKDIETSGTTASRDYASKSLEVYPLRPMPSLTPLRAPSRRPNITNKIELPGKTLTTGIATSKQEQAKKQQPQKRKASDIE